MSEGCATAFGRVIREANPDWTDSMLRPRLFRSPDNGSPTYLPRSTLQPLSRVVRQGPEGTEYTNSDCSSIDWPWCF